MDPYSMMGKINRSDSKIGVVVIGTSATTGPTTWTLRMRRLMSEGKLEQVKVQ